MDEKLHKLIRRFWQGKLSAKERRELLSELDENENAIKASMEEEFDSLQHDEQLYHAEDYRLYWEKIMEKTGLELTPPKPVRPLWHKWAPAAAVLLVIGLVYLLKPIRPAESMYTAQQVQHSASYDTLYFRNQSTDVKVITMMDGTVVELQAGSSIAYDERYGLQQRHIQLKGEAKFHVARDTSRPFVVESNGYTTTALGTSFIIGALAANRVDVRLLSGKVVVKSTAKAIYTIPDQYLTPGEELTIHIGESELKRAKFRTDHAPSTVVTERSNVTVKESVVSRLHFKEAGLSMVFKDISQNRGVRFDVRQGELQGLYFTGEFSDQDDLETILDIICRTNGLDYKMLNDSAVRIRKSESKQR